MGKKERIDLINVRKMGFEEKKEGEKSGIEESGDERENNNVNMKRVESESSLYETEDETEDAEGNKIQLGPQCTLKEQFEKDKVQILYFYFFFNNFFMIFIEFIYIFF